MSTRKELYYYNSDTIVTQIITKVCNGVSISKKRFCIIRDEHLSLVMSYTEGLKKTPFIPCNSTSYTLIAEWNKTLQKYYNIVVIPKYKTIMRYSKNIHLQ